MSQNLFFDLYKTSSVLSLSDILVGFSFCFDGKTIFLKLLLFFFFANVRIENEVVGVVF